MRSRFSKRKNSRYIESVDSLKGQETGVMSHDSRIPLLGEHSLAPQHSLDPIRG